MTGFVQWFDFFFFKTGLASSARVARATLGDTTCVSRQFCTLAWKCGAVMLWWIEGASWLYLALRERGRGREKGWVTCDKDLTWASACRASESSEPSPRLGFSLTQL